MDVLGDVVAALTLGRPRSTLVTWRAPWGQRFPAVRGSAGFQVVLQGTCHLLGETPMRLDPGDVVFFPHGHGYTLADTPGTETSPPDCDPLGPDFAVDSVGGDGPETVTLCGGYELAPSLAHPLLHDLPDLIRVPAGTNPSLSTVIDLLAAETSGAAQGRTTVIPSLLDVLLVHLLRAWLRTPHGPSGWAAALADPAVNAALRAIHAEPSHAWTVESLAAEARLSRSAFARRFTALTGRPPLAYLTWWRMAQAAHRLQTTDAPIAEIAATHGYTSEFAFTHAFKRHHGTPPARYRRQNRSNQPDSQ